MFNIDEKFKDAHPVDTVDRIRALLRAQNIDLEEVWLDSGIRNCFTVNVSIAGTGLTANGKGVTRELARASGHAELMERLQSGYRGIGAIRFADAQAVSQQEILDECGAYLQATADRIRQKEGVDMTSAQLLENLSGFNAQSKTVVVPFLNAFDGTKTRFPINLIRVLCSSTGLCAGNSPEEAMIQGLSEIVERYCQDRYLREKLTPPTVPDEYLKQFPTAWKIICQTREAGYFVRIKDCSLGEGYPVVASIVIDRKTHHNRVIFGASPIFEIALERSLTEMYQGQVVQKLAKVSGVFTGKTRSLNDLEGAFVAGRTIYPIEFFAENPAFVLPADRSSLTNRELLPWALQWLKARGRTMFVRDMSHYGFGTYRLYVPGMSEISPWQFRGNPSHYRLGAQTGMIACDICNANDEQLLLFTMRYKMAATASGGVPDYTALAGLPLQISPEMNRYLSYCVAAYAEWQVSNVKQAYLYALRARNLASDDLRPHWEYLCRVLEARFDGYPFERTISLLECFFEDGLAQTMRENFAKNPFERYLPRCDKQCGGCSFAEKCRYLAHKAVMDHLNEVVAQYDNNAAFDRLRQCLGC